MSCGGYGPQSDSKRNRAHLDSSVVPMGDVVWHGDGKGPKMHLRRNPDCVSPLPPL